MKRYYHESAVSVNLSHKEDEFKEFIVNNL